MMKIEDSAIYTDDVMREKCQLSRFVEYDTSVVCQILLKELCRPIHYLTDLIFTNRQHGGQARIV